MIRSRSKAERAEAKEMSSKVLRGMLVRGDRIGYVREPTTGARALCRFIAAVMEYRTGHREPGEDWEGLRPVPRDITLAMCNVLGYRYSVRGFASVNYPDEAVSDLARELFGDGTLLRAERL